MYIAYEQITQKKKLNCSQRHVCAKKHINKEMIVSA